MRPRGRGGESVRLLVRVRACSAWGNAPQRRLDDHAERAEAHLGGAEGLGVALGRAHERRAVSEHERELDHLARDVAQARAGTVRGRRDRAGERLHVDVAEVLHREAMRVEPAAELADRDASLHPREAALPVHVEHAGQAVEVQHQPVGAGDLAEGVPRSHDPHPSPFAPRPLDRGGHLLHRPRRRRLSRRAALVASPVAPSGGAHVTISRLAHQMNQPEPTPSPGARTSRARALPSPGAKRASVIGAGSFGTALAVLLARGGLRTTLQTRTAEQAALIDQERENRRYLPGVQLPAHLRVEPASAGVARADYVFLAVPSRGLGQVIERLGAAGLGRRTAVVSVAKGLVPPHGMPPTVVLAERFGASRVACIGGPAHAQEMVHAGAGLVAASAEEELARSLAQVFTRAGVVCEVSNDPVGVELAGAAKNAAALAAGATEAQGLNAAGAAAGHIFAEVWRYAETLDARPESMIGLAGAGDLLATALARESRNRRAGELLAAGVSAAEIPTQIGQAVEALESVPLLARAVRSAGVGAPVTSALARLIAGELPLDEWVALVRATVPPPALWRRRPNPGFWRRVWRRLNGR
jgi:glycerol-3-phosphate dehydrogenase (NAD(P)+)